MDFKDFFAGQNDNDRRIDKIIRIFVPELSLSQIYKALRKGLIKVNDKKIQQDYHVCVNDKISIASFLINNSATSETIHQNHSKIDLPPVIFQNDHLLIINKPSDINVHGNSNGQISLENIVCEYFKTAGTKGDLAFKPGPLHRLDKMTTGLLAFSWSIDGARWFSENIKNHTIQKKYLGIVQGNLKSKSQWHDNIDKNDSQPLEKDSNKFHTVKINENSQDEKTAWTTATPLLHGSYKNTEITLVEFDIHTGRQHQIRAQSSFHGFPLIGDSAYNGETFNKSIKSFFLHAYELIFPVDNPVGLPDVLKADLPLTFLDFLSKTCDISDFKV